MRVKIAPSMVESDLTRLAQAAAEVTDGGADLLHVDVADGHFVPNFMLGPQLTRAAVRCSSVPVGVHLMIADPLRYAPTFAEAGPDTIFFHVEAVPDLPEAVRQVAGLGVNVGVAIKPDTPAESILDAAGLLDFLMVMTVEPGFSGQGFMEGACRKIPELRSICGDEVDIYVDGGINPDTAPTAVGYGANVMVAASSVFRAEAPPAQAVRLLRGAAEAAMSGD